MRRAETLPGARGANVSGRKELSSRMFFIAAALAIVLIACVLGRATFSPKLNREFRWACEHEKLPLRSLAGHA
jgi:hypothetical protein